MTTELRFNQCLGCLATVGSCRNAREAGYLGCCPDCYHPDPKPEAAPLGTGLGHNSQERSKP